MWMKGVACDRACLPHTATITTLHNVFPDFFCSSRPLRLPLLPLYIGLTPAAAEKQLKH